MIKKYTKIVIKKTPEFYENDHAERSPLAGLLNIRLNAWQQTIALLGIVAFFIEKNPLSGCF